MSAAVAAEHQEWLSLLDVSGPFLTLPVLLQYLPDGLDTLDREAVPLLRAALAARDAADTPEDACRGCVTAVLLDMLAFDTTVLLEAASFPAAPCLSLPEMGEELRPDFVLVPPQGGESLGLLDLDSPAPEADMVPRSPVLLVSLAPGCRLEAPMPGRACSWSPARRMAELCRASGIPLGLVSNGRQFMLVHARQNRTTTFVTWEADLWLEERITLRSFVTLLHRRRFFGLSEENTLPSLMEKSADAQQSVTDRLGEQVRSAITEFLHALDSLKRHQNGHSLLADIPAPLLYEAALTVMMRLVFLLSAEERGMFPLGEPTYDAAYAASTLCASLREEADKKGEEVLEKRHDAWVRLLSLFRAVFGGIHHENLRMLPHEGSLFDPDVYPFLEGRAAQTHWRDVPAQPLPVNNRVILHMLESLQFLRDRRTTGRDEAVRLSFRGLDVEQIGHVYEGLLDRTARRADAILLGLAGKAGTEPFMALAEAEALRQQGEEPLVQALAARTGVSPATLRRLLHGEKARGTAAPRGTLAEAAARDEAKRAATQLRMACDGNPELMERVRPFAPLLRQDSFGYPLVVPQGGLYVTEGTQRRDTGTHYTPRALTELLVAATLEPHVYDGPAQGLPREQWRLRPVNDLLALKICDMTMGSGAFLVQTCRYLSERVLEAWAQADAQALTPFAPLPDDAEERLAYARRLVADRCLYGVDNNPLAVEMAKLSLWLTTMQKNRPFTFLDHALRCGDALMGLTSVPQLENFTLFPRKDVNDLVFGSMDMQEAVTMMQTDRTLLESFPSDTPLNVERKAALLQKTEGNLRKLRRRADALIMAVVARRGVLSEEARYEMVDKLLHPTFSDHPEELDAWLEEQRQALIHGSGAAQDQKDEDNNPGFTHPFHWVLEFPEVFERENPGFDALVGNPPFLGSQRMRGALGNFYREYLVNVLGQGAKGIADLVAYFFLRAAQLVRDGGDFGLVATNTIAQGDTREVGLLQLEQKGYAIRAAWPDTPWEGSATVCTSQIVVRHQEADAAYAGSMYLSGTRVEAISSFLKAGEEEWETKPLKNNADISFIGSYVLGKGFLTTEEQAQQWIAEDEDNENVLFPYLNGEDLTNSPTQEASRWIINFYDWSEETASTLEKPFTQVKEKVQPFRLENNRKQYRDYWWQFAEKRPALYHALGRGDAFVKHPKGWKPFPPLERVLTIARVSKYGALSFVPNTYIMSEDTCIFATTDAAMFGVLQSAVHHAWARKMSSTLGLGLRYTPSSAFVTFPRPSADRLSSVRDCAECLHAARAAVMVQEQIGLTAFYNKLHDPDSKLPALDDLRTQHEELDKLVAAAYGWDDLDMSHDFRQVAYLPANDNIRHTIAEPVRLEVLRRLTRLNKQRWEEENATTAPSRKTSTGTSTATTPAPKSRSPRRTKVKTNSQEQARMLG